MSNAALCIHCHEPIEGSISPPSSPMHFACAYLRKLEETNGPVPYTRTALQAVERARSIALRTGDSVRAALLEQSAALLAEALDVRPTERTAP